MKLTTKKGGMAVKGVVAAAIAFMVAAIVAGILFSMLSSVEGTGPCSRLFRGVASVLADMTGVNMCQ